jgi:hypothetical protein
LSASETFNYGLTQVLVRRLFHLKKHSTIIEDLFKFVDELHRLDIDMTTHKLVSFDVISLFTNISLYDTIEIILLELYKDECYCTYDDGDVSGTNKKRKMIETCLMCINRSNFKWLLETATCRTHFHFNNKIFSQIIVVAMGLLIGPLLADIFLVHLENKLMNQLEQNGIVYWRRYIDDTLPTVRGVWVGCEC